MPSLSCRNLLLLIGVVFLSTFAIVPSSAFTSTFASLHHKSFIKPKEHCIKNNILFQSQNQPSDEKSNSNIAQDKVAVGSSEYYQGFISRSVNDEPVERITGDAILGPTLKFVGGVSVVLVLLTLAFLASNGII
ncbi:hypothetical protein HJC23_005810 [Cyclotella cryptica]|uniref:Transmembrane protein n=1 Tax=Cyclotella cryptica TaxID=29204 RepID=A0ABD3R184_9STRA